jgi:hypothetical protein
MFFVHEISVGIGLRHQNIPVGQHNVKVCGESGKGQQRRNQQAGKNNYVFSLEHVVVIPPNVDIQRRALARPLQ